MSFSEITQELQKELRTNMPQIRFFLKKTPSLAFNKINEIAAKIGTKHSLILSLNFPEKERIEDYESYGMENISIVIDKHAKTFPIKRELIKSKASEIFGSVKIQDAYMYEGKEGVRVLLSSGRLDILPSSLHVWGRFDQKIMEFCDWLLVNCYQKPDESGSISDLSS